MTVLIMGIAPTTALVAALFYPGAAAYLRVVGAFTLALSITKNGR
jgi:hypothetical protein